MFIHTSKLKHPYLLEAVPSFHERQIPFTPILHNLDAIVLSLVALDPPAICFLFIYIWYVIHFFRMLYELLARTTRQYLPHNDNLGSRNSLACWIYIPNVFQMERLIDFLHLMPVSRRKWRHESDNYSFPASQKRCFQAITDDYVRITMHYHKQHAHTNQISYSASTSRRVFQHQIPLPSTDSYNRHTISYGSRLTTMPLNLQILHMPPPNARKKNIQQYLLRTHHR